MADNQRFFPGSGGIRCGSNDDGVGTGRFATDRLRFTGAANKLAWLLVDVFRGTIVCQVYHGRRGADPQAADTSY